MAYSSSINKGQIPICCQLCETDIKIKWKCLDCNLLLCQQCKVNVHLKFKNATYHSVINIKEVDGVKSAECSKIECEEHPGQNSCLFCVTCSKYVCPICIAKVHNGHELVEMTKSNVTGLHNKKPELKVELSVVKKFDTLLTAIEFMCILSDNSLWISSGKYEQLQNIKLEDNNLKVVSQINILVGSMAVIATDNLLFVTNEATALKQIDHVNEAFATTTSYDVAPLQPTCVHVTREGKLMIGARGGDKPIPATGRRVITEMDMFGNHKTLYEYDRHNRPLFTYVKSICTTQNGRVCVVDTVASDHKGRILFLGQSGDVLNIYNGNTDISEQRFVFTPRTILSTPSDNIITNDLYNHTLLIFDNSGNLITYHYTKDIGIEYPFSLALTNQGQFYIGCGEGQDGKLYLLDISGC